MTLVLKAQRKINVFKYDLNVDSDGADHTLSLVDCSRLLAQLQQTHVHLGHKG